MSAGALSNQDAFAGLTQRRRADFSRPTAASRFQKAVPNDIYDTLLPFTTSELGPSRARPPSFLTARTMPWET